MPEIRRQLVIQSEMANLKKVREFISKAVTDSCLPETEKNKIMLATDEAVANLVKHGYKYDPQGRIEIQVYADDKKFEVKILDSSEGFDFDSIPSPNLEEHIRQGKRSGLGIYLIRKVMDEVHYKLGEKNQLTLVKYIR